MEDNNVQQCTQQEENKEKNSNNNANYEELDNMIAKGTEVKKNGISKSYLTQKGMSNEEAEDFLAHYEIYRAEKEKAAIKEHPDYIALQKELENLKGAAQKQALNNQIQLKAFDLGLNKKAVNAMLKIEDFSDVIVDGKVDDSKLETKMSAFLDEYDVFKPQATVQGKPGVGVGAKQVDKDEEAKQNEQLRKYFGLN